MLFQSASFETGPVRIRIKATAPELVPFF